MGPGALPSANIPQYSVVPYWVQLGWAEEGTQQGIYYQFNGASATNPTTLSIEYYLTNYNDDTQEYHFLVYYDTTAPGVWWVYYFDVSDAGAHETIGAQGPGILGE